MLKEPVENLSYKIIEKALKKHKRIAVGSSFGKDSIVLLKLATDIKPDIPVFSIMTMYKPPETYRFLRHVYKKMNLNLKVYMVHNKIPFYLKGLDITLLPLDEFVKKCAHSELMNHGKELYATNPDECCRLLKVEPTKIAVKKLTAWMSGLRKSEGRTRINFKHFERKGGLVKINPILDWIEADIWRFTAVNKLPVNPLYGKGYRSLGCSPCSSPGGKYERSGRWQGTKKVGGECGIHTLSLRTCKRGGKHAT